MQNKIKFLLILFLMVFLLTLGLGSYYFLTSNNIQNPLKSLAGKQSSIQLYDVEVKLQSNLNNYDVEFDNTKTEKIKSILSNLNLNTFENVNFQGFVDSSDVSPNIISPKKILITLYSTDKLKADLDSNKDLAAQTFNLQETSDKKPLKGFFVGRYDSKSQTVTIPLYLNEEWIFAKDQRLSQTLIETIFFNFQRKNINEFENLSQYVYNITPINESFLIHKKKIKLNFDLNIIKTANAQYVCGYSICEQRHVTNKCFLSGYPCDNSADCPIAGESCHTFVTYGPETWQVNCNSIYPNCDLKSSGCNNGRIQESCIGFVPTPTPTSVTPGPSTPAPGCTDNYCNPPGGPWAGQCCDSLSEGPHCLHTWVEGFYAACAPPPPPPPPPTPACTIVLAPDPGIVSQGSTLNFSASITSQQNGTVDQITFASNDTNIVTVNPASDNSLPFITVATGGNAGSTTITATAYMGGVARCSDTATATVSSPAWWQAVGGDVISNVGVISLISPQCTSPGCNPNLIRDGAGGFPGIVSYVNVYDFQAGTGTGTASSKGWLVQANAQQNSYSYSSFAALVPSTAVINTIPAGSTAGTTLTSGGTASPDGYYWYKVTGDLTISSAAAISGRKVILLVEGGNLAVNGNITTATPGNDFLLTIVGKDGSNAKGTIVVANTVTQMDGLYFADNAFQSGAGNQQLTLRGSLAASSFSLQRDLGAGNTSSPSEVFEFSPAMLFAFPQSLLKSDIQWQEVAP